MMLTSTSNYSRVIRKRFFSSLQNHLIEFSKLLSPSTKIITENDIVDFQKYTIDWTRKFISDKVFCVVFPVSTNEVSKVLRYCNENNLAVIPQGGNTGLVGGGVGSTIGDSRKPEVIVSLTKMNKIIEINTDNLSLTCEAGCILEDLNSLLASKYGLQVPLDLGSKGSCQIGGNVATNAGGLRVVKYGTIGKSVLGLEFVLADGRVLKNMLQTFRKDNTGYHLKDIFVGSEGTLGVITKVFFPANFVVKII